MASTKEHFEQIYKLTIIISDTMVVVVVVVAVVVGD